MYIHQYKPFCHGRVVKGVGHLDHFWSYSVRKVVSSIPDRGNIVGWVFHPTRWLARFSLIWTCLSFQILNLFRTLSSWGSGNYRPSAPLLYEVASHVKQLPFRPLLLLLLLYPHLAKELDVLGGGTEAAATTEAWRWFIVLHVQCRLVDVLQ